MEIVAVQFMLMAFNLFGAQRLKMIGKNPAFNYFVAGMTFGFGTVKLLEILFK